TRCSEFDDDVWQTVLDVGWSVAGRIKKEYPDAPEFPEVRIGGAPLLLQMPPKNYPDYLKKMKPRPIWSESNLEVAPKIVVSRLSQSQGIDVKGNIADRLVLCNGPIVNAVNCVNCVVFVNGDIEFRSNISNSIV